MYNVECRDHVKLRRQPFRDIAFFETHPICYACVARVRSGASDGRTKIIVASVARPRKRLRQFDEPTAPSASHVCDVAAALKMRFHLWHRGDPFLQQQILKPRTGEP